MIYAWLRLYAKCCVRLKCILHHVEFHALSHGTNTQPHATTKPKQF